MKKLILSGLLALTLLPVSQASNANLVTNGSFELGGYIPSSNDTMTLNVGSTAMDKWIVTNDAIAWIGSANPWSLTANEGNYFLDLTDFSTGAPFGSVYQNITTDIGQSYQLSFDLGSSNLWGRPSAIEVSAAGLSNIFTSNIIGGVSDWDQFSMVFTANAAMTTIVLGGVTGSQYIGLDNVSVSAVPEPSSLLLFILGMGVLFAFVNGKRASLNGH